jgi:hypothetical protein
MTQEELKAFYEKRLTGFTASLKLATGRINLISNIRLAVALLFILLIYLGLSNYSIYYWLPLLVIVFVVLVQRHSLLFEKRTHLENLITIHQNEIRSVDGNFSGFDGGNIFIDGHHAFTHDLDVFGEGSLFQAINRCHTTGGKQLLASRLSSAFLSAGQITQNQEAIKDVTGKTDFRHEIQACGMEVEELADDRRQLREWVSHPSFLYGKNLYRISLVVFPLVTITLLFLSFFIDGISTFFWIAAALQWVFLGFHLKRINDFHQYISRKKTLLAKYARLLRAIETGQFASALMAALSEKAKDADRKLSVLASLAGGLDARLNSMMNVVVNGLLLYDMQFVYRLEKWKEENASRLEHWIETVEEVEVICSFGTFAFNNPEFIFPHINEERRLGARRMAHPLIDPKERVANDLMLDRNTSVMIITGANMAGKSTFLRTVGINVLLALNGAPVCALEFDCPIIEMRSGMRTADSLRDHQSYFYAELNRLQSIIQELKSGKQLLILLDEILKGTNSTDKQAGSIALVKQLIGYPALVLVATHDLALGDLEKAFPSRIGNYCFEASIVDDQLSFDYKLKQGIAQKMNATFLMKKMGIIPVP